MPLRSLSFLGVFFMKKICDRIYNFEIRKMQKNPFNNQWKIIFKWENGNAFEVEIIDYH